MTPKSSVTFRNKGSLLTHLPSMGWLHVCIRLGIRMLFSYGEQKVSLGNTQWFPKLLLGNGTPHIFSHCINQSKLQNHPGINGTENFKPLLRRGTIQSSLMGRFERGTIRLNDNTSYSTC